VGGAQEDWFQQYQDGSQMEVHQVMSFPAYLCGQPFVTVALFLYHKYHCVLLGTAPAPGSSWASDDVQLAPFEEVRNRHRHAIAGMDASDVGCCPISVAKMLLHVQHISIWSAHMLTLPTGTPTAQHHCIQRRTACAVYGGVWLQASSLAPKRANLEASMMLT
jgi:hypothetical protein